MGLYFIYGLHACVQAPCCISKEVEGSVQSVVLLCQAVRVPWLPCPCLLPLSAKGVKCYQKVEKTWKLWLGAKKCIDEKLLILMFFYRLGKKKKKKKKKS